LASEHLAGGHFQPESGLDLKWSATRLRAMVTSQARSRGLPGEGADAAQARRKVSLVEVLGGGFASHSVVDVPVHGVAVLVVQTPESVGLAGLGTFDEVHHAGAVAVRGGTAGGGGAGRAPSSADRSAAVGQCVARTDGCGGGEGGAGRTRWGRSREQVQDRCAQRSRPEASTRRVGTRDSQRQELPSRAVPEHSPVVATEGRRIASEEK